MRGDKTISTLLSERGERLGMKATSVGELGRRFRKVVEGESEIVKRLENLKKKLSIVDP